MFLNGFSRSIHIGIAIICAVIAILSAYSNISSSTTSVESERYSPETITDVNNSYNREILKSNIITFHFVELPVKKGFIELLVVKNSRGFSEVFPHVDDIAFKTSINIDKTAADRVSINTDLKPGRYAAKFFIDLNGNKEFDTNVIGFPLEPFGFSKKPMFLTGLPNFEEVFFVVKPDQTLELKFEFYYF